MATVRVSTGDDTFEFLDGSVLEAGSLKVYRPDGSLWAQYPAGSYAYEIVEPKPARVKAEAKPAAAEPAPKS